MCPSIPPLDRDLADEIGGISVLSALGSLESEPQTQVIAILSKPPGKRTLAHILPKIQACSKPVVTCFLGETRSFQQEDHPFRVARTLNEAAAAAVQIAGESEKPPIPAEPQVSRIRLQVEKAAMKPGQKYIRGVFAGGTFCYQSQQILRDAGIRVSSNVPLEGNSVLTHPHSSLKHTLVDMGADEFTSGRPHPMIDSSQRRERILAEAQDPEVAVLLLDFILGFNASADPAGELLPAITRAKEEVRKRGGFLCVTA